MNLLTQAIGAAASGISGLVKLNGAARNITAQATFTYGAGGTAVDAWLQTSLDQGATWTDIANWHFTTALGRAIYNLTSHASTAITPTDGAMAANTFADGVLGPWFRVKWASTGTYTGVTSLSIDVAADQLAQ